MIFSKCAREKKGSRSFFLSLSFVLSFCLLEERTEGFLGPRADLFLTRSSFKTGSIGRENVRHLAFHVRQIRRDVPSDDRHRLFIENGTFGQFERRSIATLGYGWTGEISLVNSFVYSRLLGGGDCVRRGE